MEYVTLENMARYLNVGWLGKSRNLELALKFLPDLLKADALADPERAILWKNDREREALIWGNYYEKAAYTEIQATQKYSRATDKYSNADSTERLLHALKEDEIIEYKDDLGNVSCRQNMLNKIHYIVSQTSPLKIRQLIEELPILPFRDQFLRNRLSQIILGLSRRKYYDYALFLLILSAIFRDKINQLDSLYCEAEIQKTIFSPDKILDFPDDCIYFTDKNYMNTYRVFMFRNIASEDPLYETGILTMKYEATDHFPTAEMVLEDSHKEIRRHRYAGTPILIDGKTVYISMCDEENNNSLGILCFAFEDFAKGNGQWMYFRLGLFFSCDFRYRTPQIQKVVIANPRRCKDKDVQMAVKGLLKTSGTRIIYDLRSLNAFITCEEYKNDSWMQKFRTSIYPKLNKENDYCCITEEELLNWQTGTFSSEELIKATYAFKNHSEEQWRKKNTHYTCYPPEDFHFLLRDK